MRCKICNNIENNEKILVREMMYDGKESFEYNYCKLCGTLSLIERPKCLQRYYDKEYYSFNTSYWEDDSHFRIDEILLSPWVSGGGGVKRAIEFITRRPKQLKYIGMNSRTKECAILDIGCGNGDFLKYLVKHGYKNVHGIDPYVEGETDLVSKKNIFQLQQDTKEKFDIILMNHSFEHMDNPKLVLKAAKEMLNNNGVIIMRIPVCGGSAWKMYRESWYQIDAPRHLYLYTPKSLREILNQEELYIKSCEYDSTSSQFLVSDLYSKGIVMSDFNHEIVCRSVNKYVRIFFKILTPFINLLKRGDQAIFVICQSKKG